MKTIILCLLFFPLAVAAKFQYVSPMPGSVMNNPEHHIILREGNEIDPRSLNSDLFILHGSKSGDHVFRLVFSEDRKTILLYPFQPFGFDEEVTVSVGSGLQTTAGNVIEPYSFTFQTHREYTASEQKDFKDLKSILLQEEMEKELAKETEREDPSARQLVGSFTIVKNTNPTPGQIFYDAWNGGFGSKSFDGYNIITPAGDSVYASGNVSICFDFSINPNGYLSVYNENKGGFDILDSNYTVIDTYYPGNGRSPDPHEFTIYPNGHAFMVAEETQVMDLTIYNPSYSNHATVMGTVVQEFDAAKNIIFEWRAFDHVVITESYQNLAFTYIDYVHTNSIDVDTDGNLIVSNRHLNQINKININTGEFIWRLGGVMNQFTFINEPEPFTYEHDCRRISNGNITLWDNGNLHTPNHSMAKEYHLDEVNKTATLVWSFQPKTYSNTNAYYYAMGSVQRLPNGNTLMNGGWDGSSNQSNMWEVTPGGEIVWELALDNSKSLVAYRALKYTWIPCAPVKTSSIKVKSITNNSAKVTWKAVKNAVTYDVQFRKLGKVVWKNKATTHLNVLLQNLLSNTTYEYQVRAHCLNGYASDWSPIKTFTTLPQKVTLAEETVTLLQLHPNPTSGLMNLDIHCGQDQSAVISVYDLSGKRVYNDNTGLTAGDQSVQLNLSALPSGVYVVEVLMPEGNQRMKFVKE
jgi:hypothetical protein